MELLFDFLEYVCDGIFESTICASLGSHRQSSEYTHCIKSPSQSEKSLVLVANVIVIVTVEWKNNHKINNTPKITNNIIFVSNECCPRSQGRHQQRVRRRIHHRRHYIRVIVWIYWRASYSCGCDSNLGSPRKRCSQESTADLPIVQSSSSEIPTGGIEKIVSSRRSQYFGSRPGAVL